MNMIEHFRRLFAYDDWANREVLASLRMVEGAPQRSLKLLGHILSAERLWWERIEQQKQTLPVWPDFTMQQCESEIAEMSVRWKQYLDKRNEANLRRSVNYKNSKGEDWSSREEDILLHMIMHSVYHRGQIAADMRAAGFTPAYTDFIYAVRQGLVE
jgi:uncharacterized damage-inducible protein DinB